MFGRAAADFQPRAHFPAFPGRERRGLAAAGNAKLAAGRSPVADAVTRIRVRLLVGDSLMAASDDPLFLGVRGPQGREFRLEFAHGKSRRRGKEDVYVLGAPDDPDTNVAHAEFNDPTQPPIDVESVSAVYLRKGLEPIPNVRAMGEMDDRLELVECEVTLDHDGPKPLRFVRRGPIWLGLVAGLHLELPPDTDRG